MPKGLESHAAEKLRRRDASGEQCQVSWLAQLLPVGQLYSFNSAVRWPSDDCCSRRVWRTQSFLFVNCAVVFQAAVPKPCAKEDGQPEAHGNRAVYEKYMLAVVTIKAQALAFCSYKVKGSHSGCILFALSCIGSHTKTI